MKNKATKQNQMTIRLQHLPILSISLLISHIDLLHRLGLLIALNINTHTHQIVLEMWIYFRAYSYIRFRNFECSQFKNFIILCVFRQSILQHFHIICASWRLASSIQTVKSTAVNPKRYYH